MDSNTMDNVVDALNEILAKELGYTKKVKGAKQGTSYVYYMGSVGNKRVGYTRAKTWFKGRFGFWSWIQTEYKNGKIKRRRFALSRTKKKAMKRAERLLEKLKEQK